MAKLLIVYHSNTGNTEVMARAVYEGASSAGATVIIKKAAEATDGDLLDCDAVAFGTPTNFGYMAGTIKDFFDQAWLTIGEKPARKRYSAFTSAGSGQKMALDGIDRICNSFNQYKQFKFEKACEGIVATLKPSSDVLEQCKELGKKLAQS